MDAVTLAILKGRLEQIADEMDATLFRQPLIRLLPRHMMQAMVFMMGNRGNPDSGKVRSTYFYWGIGLRGKGCHR